MSISASMVKELRDKTGAGMMDCKAALQECGDLEKAIDWLRQKGLAKAAKRADRATSEGTISSEIHNNGKLAVLVEVKCETDFVANSDKFQDFAKNVAMQVAASDNPDSNLLEQPLVSDNKLTLQDLMNELVASIGENITVGRFTRLQLDSEGTIGSYIHNNGKLAVVVEVKCESEAAATSETVQEFAKNIAMQIAATNPLAVDATSLDPALLEREREVYRQKAREEGKPENIIEKIAEGAVKKYCKEVCLMEQPFIKDDKLTLQDLLKQIAGSTKENITIGRFTRLQLGVE